MTTIKSRPTYEDYLNTLGDERYELINGESILVGSPSTAHQVASMGFSLEVGGFVRNRDLGIVFAAPFDVLLYDDDGVNVVQPDLIFVSRERERVITRANIQGAPDLIVEILSPSTGRLDRTAKRDLYARHGLKEYWIADPEARTVEVMFLKDGSFETTRVYSIGDALVSPTFKGFSAGLDRIFV